MIKKRKPKSKNYFTQETEDSIVLYNTSIDSEFKSKIYKEKIHYAFFKLTENIIHTFKFYHTEVEELEQIADAVLELFRKRDTIDVFNKKALYIYIREIVDVKTPKITKVADKLHNIFKSKYYFYLENGHCKF